LKSVFNLAGAVLISGMTLSSAALAQSAPAPATATAPTDVKVIGDWTVRCFSVTGPSPCDMYQELDDETSHQRVFSISIAYAPTTDRHAMEISVPLGVSIPKGVVIQTDSYTSTKLPYWRCDRNGCYVGVTLPNDAVNSLTRSGPTAAVKFDDDNGKTYSIKLSLNGFSAAHDAMTLLANQKAKAPVQPSH
jgi:invasion protein IalB